MNQYSLTFSPPRAESGLIIIIIQSMALEEWYRIKIGWFHSSKKLKWSGKKGLAYKRLRAIPGGYKNSYFKCNLYTTNGHLWYQFDLSISNIF